MNRRKWLKTLAIAGTGMATGGTLAGESRWRRPRFFRRGENFRKTHPELTPMEQTINAQ